MESASGCVPLAGWLLPLPLPVGPPSALASAPDVLLAKWSRNGSSIGSERKCIQHLSEGEERTQRLAWQRLVVRRSAAAAACRMCVLAARLTRPSSWFPLCPPLSPSPRRVERERPAASTSLPASTLPLRPLMTLRLLSLLAGRWRRLWWLRRLRTRYWMARARLRRARCESRRQRWQQCREGSRQQQAAEESVHDRSNPRTEAPPAPDDRRIAHLPARTHCRSSSRRERHRRAAGSAHCRPALLDSPADRPGHDERKQARRRWRQQAT